MRSTLWLPTPGSQAPSTGLRWKRLSEHLAFKNYIKENKLGGIQGYERGCPCGSVIKDLPANAGSLVWEHPGNMSGNIPWRCSQGMLQTIRKLQTIPVFLPGKSHGQRSLGGLQSMGSQRVKYILVTDQWTKCLWKDWTSSTYSSIFLQFCSPSPRGAINWWPYPNYPLAFTSSKL